jgi:hypothetical protein
MTLGDPGLEREVPEAFMHQAALMLRRIAVQSRHWLRPRHTPLKGSARGIGA